MAGYVNGGVATGSSGSTGNVMNSTGFDRLLVVHFNAISQNTIAAWKYNGATLTALSTSLPIPANSVYDLGPIFFGSTESLIGGLGTSSGSWVIDELRL